MENNVSVESKLVSNEILQDFLYEILRDLFRNITIALCED